MEFKSKMNLEKVAAISQMLFLNFFFMLERDPRAPYLSGYCFFIPQKKIPYVASTKRIVYIFLNECQGEKKTKTKPSLNLLL